MNNDLISRSALIKWIDDSVSQYGHIYSTDMLNMWGLFKDYLINNAPTVEYPFYQEAYQTGYEEGKNERPQGKWIPVSEGLPDKNMSCLVSVGKFNITQIAMYSDLIGSRKPKIFYQNDYGKGGFQNITAIVNAWQPLPEPYMKGGVE